MCGFTTRDAAADLLLGARCPVCGRPGARLCAGCRAALEPRPVATVLGGLPVVAAGDYARERRAAVVAFKERGAHGLAGPLGEQVAAALAVLLPDPGPWALVPVPSAPAAVRTRVADVTALLARAASRVLRGRGADVRVVRALRQARRVADQSGLGVDARAANLRGSLRARPAPRATASAGERARCLIVDDVVTSGATIVESERALTASGWIVAGAAVVAATPLRVHPG